MRSGNRVLAAVAAALSLGMPPAFAGDEAQQAPVSVDPAAACALVHPCGDVNATGSVTSGDALAVLRLAVGQEVDVQCEVEGDGGGGSSLLRTGQTKCYSGAGTEISCEGSGQDAETKAGVALAYTDNGNGTITDDKTGLVWEKLDDANLDGDAGIHDKDRTYSWTQAAEKIATFNVFSFGGRSDWRIPNVRELQSLVNFGRVEPAIASIFDSSCSPGCKVSSCSCTGTTTLYWSSTNYEDLRSHAWATWFMDGQSGAHAKTTAFYVRAVAGGS